MSFGGNLSANTRSMRPTPSPDSSTMQSLPRELIDKLINNFLHSGPHSCLPDGGRWRRRSRHIFAFIGFWFRCSLVHEHPTGPTPTYVRSVRSERIHSWREPALFGRALGVFTPITAVERRCPTPSHHLTVFRAPCHLESPGRRSNNPPSCYHDPWSRRSRSWFPPSRAWRGFFPSGRR